MINYSRTPDAPASLALRQKYDDDDVRTQLHTDSLEKCYLCESVVAFGAFEVDHRQPKNEDVENRTYAWWNLYCCCRPCNGRRQRKSPVGGWLHPENDPEGKLIQEIDLALPRKFRFAARDSSDAEAVNAASELKRIHCDTHPKSNDLRNAIFIQLAAVNRAERRVFEALLNPNMDAWERTRREEDFRDLVSRSAPFTALVRSWVSEHLSYLFD